MLDTLLDFTNHGYNKETHSVVSFSNSFFFHSSFMLNISVLNSKNLFCYFIWKDKCNTNHIVLQLFLFSSIFKWESIESQNLEFNLFKGHELGMRNEIDLAQSLLHFKCCPSNMPEKCYKVGAFIIFFFHTSEEFRYKISSGFLN